MYMLSLRDEVRSPSQGTLPNPTLLRASRMPGCMLTTLSHSSSIVGCAMSTNIPSKQGKERQAWATGSTPYPLPHSPKWRMDLSNGDCSTGLGLRHLGQVTYVVNNSLVPNSRARHCRMPLAHVVWCARRAREIRRNRLRDFLVEYVKTTLLLPRSRLCPCPGIASRQLGKPELFTRQTFTSQNPMARTLGLMLGLHGQT